MVLIPAIKFLFPEIYPTFAKFKDTNVATLYAGDPRIASDHRALWKILLAWEVTVGFNPNGRYSTMEARVRDCMRIQMRLVTAPNTGVDSWSAGKPILWNNPLEVPGNQSIFPFTAPPFVFCAYRGTDTSNNHPARFWVGADPPGIAEDPLGTTTIVKARAKDGSGLSGVGTHTVSCLGIQLLGPVE